MGKAELNDLPADPIVWVSRFHEAVVGSRTAAMTRMSSRKLPPPSSAGPVEPDELAGNGVVGHGPDNTPVDYPLTQISIVPQGNVSAWWSTTFRSNS